jgi:hypothetical protein
MESPQSAGARKKKVPVASENREHRRKALTVAQYPRLRRKRIAGSASVAPKSSRGRDKQVSGLTIPQRMGGNRDSANPAVDGGSP